MFWNCFKSYNDSHCWIADTHLVRQLAQCRDNLWCLVVRKKDVVCAEMHSDNVRQIQLEPVHELVLSYDVDSLVAGVSFVVSVVVEVIAFCLRLTCAD